RATSSAKWLTKIFADDCVQKLINFYEQTPSSNLYFDYIATKECLQTYQNEDYLVIHLNTLITFFIHVMYINKYPGRDKNGKMVLKCLQIVIKIMV
ncbi:unnamed protein product, partial [Rotaria sp. Silwood1]